MEHRPMNGAEPLTPPEADVAQAYLDELGAVQARREGLVDRRGAAWLALAEAVVLPVYVTIAGLSIGVTQSSSAFLVWMVIFFVWIQLCNERRDGLGGLSRSRSKTWAAVIGLSVLLIGLFAGRSVAATLEVDLPVIVFLVPGVVALLVLGIPAIRDIRSSSPVEPRVARRALTRSERWATVVIGAALAVSTCALGYADELLLSFLSMALMVGCLAWWAVGRSSERMPAPGAIWAWPQWLAFALSAAVATCAVLVRLTEATASASPLALIGAVVILALSIASALRDGRDG